MSTRHPFRLPVVRRSSHEKALDLYSNEYSAKLAALKSELDQSRARFQAETDLLRADRNRLLSQSERLRSDSERFQSLAEKLQVRADERDAFAVRVENLENANTEMQQKLASLNNEVSLLEKRRSELVAECERLAKSETGLRTNLSDAKSEQSLLQQQVDDYKAETDRLGKTELGLRDQLAKMEFEFAQAELIRDQAASTRVEELGLQVDHLNTQAENFRAETERLGSESVKLLHENARLAENERILENEKRFLKQQLRYAFSRSPLFIGTFPRSGTWMLKYFFHFLDHHARSDSSPKIEDIYELVTGSSNYAFRFSSVEDYKQLISISHWMCPGVFDLPESKTESFRSLLSQLNCFEYQFENDRNNSHYAPNRGQSKIAFVYRNPFDVYRSYADIFERRSAMTERLDYPFNPMAPFGTELMNSTSDKPFEHFISGFKDSGFIEYFAAYFMSFLLVHDAYPDHVKFFRYEDAMANRKNYLNELINFAQVGKNDDKSLEQAFSRAVNATDISTMKDYEVQLGHALSGAKTFYGEANSTHLSSKKRKWQDLFSKADIDAFRTQVCSYEPRILNYIPELKG